MIYLFIFFKMIFVDFIFFILSWLRIYLCSFFKKKQYELLQCFPYIVFVLRQCFLYIFLKSYLYQIYFFNIELADNLALAFLICFFIFLFFFFSKIVIFYIYFFFVLFFSELFLLILFFYYWADWKFSFLSFSLKYCSFPHVFFFFAFVSFFVHFFYPKLTFFFFR